MAAHSRWMGVEVKTIHATGGASANRAVLHVMADVFNADVYQFIFGNTAALGAALRAWHADVASSGHPVSWEDVVRGVAEPIASTHVPPDQRNHARYRELTEQYAVRERDALRT